jgi:hypothetical protein
MYKLKTPTLLPGKSSPIFSLRCVALHYASKRLTLSFALPPFYPLLQRRIKTKRESGIIIYLLKHFHKVSQRAETLAIPQRPCPRKRLRHKAAALFIAFPFALIQPLWLVPVQSLKQFRYLA